MNINFQRTVDRCVGIPLCGLLSLWQRFRPVPTPRQHVRAVLVILLSEMGSLVLAYPMFRKIKEKYPDASLYVMVFEKNRELLELLNVTPAQNIITVNNRTFKTFCSDSWRAVRQLRALPLDVVIDCELFARISSIFSYLSGAPVRVGFHPHTQEGLYKGSFINRPVMYNPYHHITHQFISMVDSIDATGRPKNKLMPQVKAYRVPQVELDDTIEKVKQQLYGEFPQLVGKKLVLLSVSGGILPIRAWPLEYFKQLCVGLVADGIAVAVIGLADEKAYGEALVRHTSSALCVDFTGRTTTLRHLLALFHHANLLITNDGGPAHFAPLTPIRCITLFGPETPLLYGPLDSSAYNFYQATACSPCLTAYNHRRSPCDGDNQCLKQIEPEQVLHKARQMLVVPT